MYRPDGWANPYGGDYESDLQCVAFEAGANAMLTELRKQGNKLYEKGKAGDKLVIPLNFDCVLKGTVGFSPDEVE